ncbi:hypothetical protein J0H58_23785 [bacterium]|nr:hypothetical protein [bacterium]
MVFSHETAVAVLVALGLFVVVELVSIVRGLAAGRAARRAEAARPRRPGRSVSRAAVAAR